MFQSVVGELLGFVEGADNAERFRELGCKIWDKDARSWRGGDNLGRIYGVQWRRWKTPQALIGEATETCPDCEGKGHHVTSIGDMPCELCMGSGKAGMYPIQGYRVFDQLADVIERIKTNPYDRRLIVSAWNPWEIHNNEMALPPCHVMFQFYVRPFTPDPSRDNPPGAPLGHLDLHMYQRSADMFLGVPFNIASYSLLLSMVAQVTGYLPGRFVHTLGDAHIYLNHLSQVEEQLKRRPYPLPSLRINPSVTSIDRFKPSDFELMDYYHHPALHGEMSVVRKNT